MGLTGLMCGSTGSFNALLLLTDFYMSLWSTIPRYPKLVVGDSITMAFLLMAVWNLMRVVKFGRDPAVEIFGMSAVAMGNSPLI